MLAPPSNARSSEFLHAEACSSIRGPSTALAHQIMRQAEPIRSQLASPLGLPGAVWTLPPPHQVTTSGVTPAAAISWRTKASASVARPLRA